MNDFFKKNLIILMVTISFFGGVGFAHAAPTAEESARIDKLLEQEKQLDTKAKEEEVKLVAIGAEIDTCNGWIGRSPVNRLLEYTGVYSARCPDYQNLIKKQADQKSVRDQAFLDLNKAKLETGKLIYKTAETPEEKAKAKELYQLTVEDVAAIESEIQVSKNDFNYEGKCEFSRDISLIACFKLGLVYGGGLIRQMVAELLKYAGTLFDFSINFSIIQISKIASIQAVTIVWTVLRDFTNMFFIFMMLYIAIGTIVEYKGVNWKTMIVTVITAAILINFSMAFVKVIIDAANIFALFFYKAAAGLAVAGAEPSIAAKIINSMGFDNFLGLSDGQIANADTSAMMVTLIGDIIVMSIAIYILVEASILLISRTVMVIFYLAFSPMPYLAMIIPEIKGFVGNFWGDLTNVALYAPAYMALLYLVTQVLDCGKIVFELIRGNTADVTAGINQTAGIAGLKQLAGNVTDTASYVQIAMFYIFASMLMLKATKLASKFGIAGADYAKSAGGWAAGLLPGLLAGGAGLAGRQTLGRLANYAAESGTMKSLETNATIGRLATGFKEYALKPAATGSFDVRGISAVKTAEKSLGIDSGKVGSLAGVGAGTGEGGYAGVLKEEKERGKYVKGVESEIKDIALLEKIKASKNPVERIEAFRAVRNKEKIRLDEYFKEVGDGKRMLIDDFNWNELNNLNKNKDLGNDPEKRRKMKDSIIKRIRECDKSIAKNAAKNYDKFSISDKEFEENLPDKCKTEIIDQVKEEKKAKKGKKGGQGGGETPANSEGLSRSGGGGGGGTKEDILKMVERNNTMAEANEKLKADIATRRAEKANPTPTPSPAPSTNPTILSDKVSYADRIRAENAEKNKGQTIYKSPTNPPTTT